MTFNAPQGPNSISTQWDRTMAVLLVVAYVVAASVLILWQPPIPTERIYILVGIGGVAVVPTVFVLMTRQANITQGKIADAQEQISEAIKTLLTESNTIGKSALKESE